VGKRVNHQEPSYGRIARAYRWLEYLAFGRALHLSRRAHLSALAKADRILVFGAGDGRVLPEILSAAPHAAITSVDLDGRMTILARESVSRTGHGDRVQFVVSDARTYSPGVEPYDAVLTQYFLDCFTEPELEELVPRIRATLRSGAQWIFADFMIPPDPWWRKARAQLWIKLLTTFFRWRTGHVPRELPPMQAVLQRCGLRVASRRTFCGGLVVAAVYVAEVG
jgi:cyclopropane fatty-acyl-phospholipid synthase-like methyltransferase